ncbi:SGNH/GDSL hydrolase family protein [bacterium]|nr:SGNH/GDSL hydrolase family protein [bacterium]
MAILKGLDGTKAIKTNYGNITDDLNAINNEVEEIVKGQDLDPNKDVEVLALRTSSEFGSFAAANIRADNSDSKIVASESAISSLDTKIDSLASGSPKGTYADLAALTAAIPAGDDFTYITLDDGNWNYWNGSAWISGGVYQSTGLADGSVSEEHISSNITDIFNGYKFSQKPTLGNQMFVDFVFDIDSIKSSVTISDKYSCLVNMLTYSNNITGLGFLFYYNNESKAGITIGGDSVIDFTVEEVIQQNKFSKVDATKQNYTVTAYKYVHAVIFLNVTDNAIFNESYISELQLMIGTQSAGIPVSVGIFQVASGVTKDKASYIDKQLLSYDNVIDVVTKDIEILKERDTNIDNLITEKINVLSDKVTYNYTTVTIDDVIYISYQFDINSILSTLSASEIYELKLNFYSDNTEIVTIGSSFWANNDSDPNVITGGISDAESYPLSYTPEEDFLYYQSREVENLSRRYIKFVLEITLNDPTAYTEIFNICNPKLRIGDVVFDTYVSTLYATQPGTFEQGVEYPSSLPTVNVVESKIADAVSTIPVASKWFGDTWDAMGDSITDESNATATLKYGEIVASRVGCTINNYGVGGTGLLTDGAATFFAMYKRITDMVTNASLITVFGGTNDWDASLYPLGVFGDFSETPDNIYNCIDYMCRKLIDRFPTKTIAFFTPTPRNDRSVNTQGYTLEDLSDAIVKVCGRYSIPVLDLYRVANMYPENADFRTALMPDGLHPNDTLHLLLADKVESFINAL